MKSLCIILAIALCGCASITGERVGSLSPGMTQTEVKKKLGNPDGYTSQGEFEVLQYSNRLMSGWGWDRADYQAVFKNGKLVSWGTGTVRQNRPPVTPVLVYGNVTTN